MTEYRVEVHGEAREIYYVDADSPEDAAANWTTGQHELTEAYGMDVYSVEEAEL